MIMITGPGNGGVESKVCDYSLLGLKVVCDIVKDKFAHIISS